MNKIIYLFALWGMLSGCLQKFEPSVKPIPSGLLVVEGVINSGQGPTMISLSRTNALYDTTRLSETGARVRVEGSDSSLYPLLETAPGNYQDSQLRLDPALRYRLRIQTQDGRSYLSDYAPVLSTPPMDSISWQSGPEGVRIFVNTQDPTKAIRYFKWDYAETWEFQSTYLPVWKFDTTAIGIQIVQTGPDLSKYTCWQTLPSTQLLLGSSVGLVQGIISDMPLNFIPRASQKLSVEYSILVHQYALTQGAYEFLEEMKKNTEETGSLFDPQPSQLSGNIHCLTSPSELVIGYVIIASAQSGRIFISNVQVPHWNYSAYCPQDSILPPKKITEALAKDEVPLYVLNRDLAHGIDSIIAVSDYCVDCTLTGTNQKPSFWP
jgi:hypothetical protein